MNDNITTWNPSYTRAKFTFWDGSKRVLLVQGKGEEPNAFWARVRESKRKAGVK